jgi:hypothetical protein
MRTPLTSTSRRLSRTRTRTSGALTRRLTVSLSAAGLATALLVAPAVSATAATAVSATAVSSTAVSSTATSSVTPSVTSLRALSAPTPTPSPGSGIGLQIDLPAPTQPPATNAPGNTGGEGTSGDGGLGTGTGDGTGGGFGGGSSGSGSGGTGGATSDLPGSTAPTSTDPVTADDEVDLGGGLFAGGISTSYIPSLNPFTGEVDVKVGVRNASKSTIDLTADFWLGGPFGNRLGGSGKVTVTDLKPGEKRIVSAVVPGAGQWGIVNAHATITPPAQIDGVDTKKVQRDAMVVIPPLYLMGLVLFALLGLAAWRIVGYVTTTVAEKKFA